MKPELGHASDKSRTFAASLRGGNRAVFRGRLALGVLLAAGLAQLHGAGAGGVVPSVDSADEGLRELPPPSLPGVVRQVVQADAGQRVAVNQGESFSVALVSIPTAGYGWALAQAPAGVALTGDPVIGPTIAAQVRPGIAGGNHWEVLKFLAKEKGAGELRLELRRPWEKGEKPIAAFAFTLDVR